MPEQKTCAECGAKFVPKKSWQRFDTAECRIAWWADVHAMAKKAAEAKKAVPA